MLPNVRLMIAATFAAVVMLIFGFGTFATFRVSHAPLERVASASPLHLFTAQDAAPRLVTAAAPFNRFEIIGSESKSIAALAYAAPEPAEQRKMNAAAPAPDPSEQTAAQPTLEPTTLMPESADARASTEQVASSDAAPETKPDETPAAATPSVAAAEPTTVALAESSMAVPAPEPARASAQAEEPDNVALAALTIEPEPALPDLATSATEKIEKTEKAGKKAKRTHTAARAHRIHKPRVVAETLIFGTQTTFQTGFGWWTPLEPQTTSAKVPRSKITAKTPEDKTAGTGGPFVAVPKQ